MKSAFIPKILPAMLLAPVLGLICLLSFASTARAEENDPPTRVARISYLHGSVSFQPGGDGEWGNAVINRPVTVGDRLWSDSDARAELQAGAAAVHLDGSTALSFLNLDERTTQMRMAEGAINFRVRELRSDDLYEVDTPNLAFTVTQAGAFRVDVNEAGDFTGVSVFRGEGEITAGGRTYKVREGERAEFRGTEKLEYSVFPAPRPDKFDRWAMERDLREGRSVSARYVSRDVVGYEDLDDYGYWRQVPGYGPMWYPTTVAVGWAPYRNGYWSWVGPWGWTWMDYEPWGFAPFHYGRWAYVGNSWGWCPGPMFVRPVYAPALVAFIGGSHWGVSLGFGGGWGGAVGWFPLGYGEPYHPWYRSSANYITRVNVTNTRINNINIINGNGGRNFHYANAGNVNAVTAVPQRAFVNAQAVNRAALRLTPGELRNAQINPRGVGNMPAPTQRSMLGASAGARVAMPPAAIENRAVFTRNQPATAARNLPVRPANGGWQTAMRAPMAAPAAGPLSRPQAGPTVGPRIGRSGVPDAAPMSPRQRELTMDKPQGYGQNSRGAMISPQAQVRNSGGVRSGVPSSVQNNDARYSQRASASPSAATPRMRAGSMTQADRPPWARASGSTSGVPDVRPMGNVYRGAGATGRPSASSAPQPRYGNSPVQRSVERPSRSYEPPAYSRPAPSYDRGSRVPDSPRYSAPAPRTYLAPRTYSAPRERSYSAPSRSSGGSGRGYSAPRGSSGGSSGGGSRGSSAPSSRGSGGSNRSNH